MHKFILRRLAMLIPVLLGVSFIVFTIMNFTPGDPIEMFLGDNYTAEAYAEMEKEMGRDKPFFTRYADYVLHAVQGDFGLSYKSHNPVSAELAARLPATMLLATAAILFAVIVAIPLGTISAAKQYSFADSLSMFAALLGVSMPNFWLGLMLILIFAANLKWLPAGQFTDLKSLILPAITLGANSLAMITRMTRSSMLETIRQDYIRTARAKGHNEFTVIVKHGLRNALIPVITTVGLQFGFAVGGAVLVEVVFSWPGIGRLLVDAIKLRDMPIVMAIVLVLAISFSVVNLCIDILYAFIDPRIRAR